MAVGLPARSVSPRFSIGAVQTSNTVAVSMTANARWRSPGAKVHGTEIFSLAMRLRGSPDVADIQAMPRLPRATTYRPSRDQTAASYPGTVHARRGCSFKFVNTERLPTPLSFTESANRFPSGASDGQAYCPGVSKSGVRRPALSTSATTTGPVDG